MGADGHDTGADKVVGDSLTSGHGSEEHRSRRRGVRGLLAVAVVLLVAGFAAPDLLETSGLPGLADRSSSPTSSPTPSPSAPGPARAPRGVLARDRAFVVAATEHMSAAFDHPAQLLFAGTLPERSRVAIAAVDRSADDGVVHVAAMVVPAGQPVRAGRASLVKVLPDEDDLLGWAGRASDGHVYTVILNRRGRLEAELSARIDYQPDGSARRDWQTARAADGALVVDLGAGADPVVVVRPLAPGPRGYPLALQVEEPAAQSGKPIVAVADTSSQPYRGPDRRAVARLVADAVRPFVPLGRARGRVLWSGRLGRHQRATVVLVRRDDGPAFQVLVVRNGASPPTVSEVRRVPWRDAATVPWLFERGERGTAVLLLTTARGGTAVVRVPGEPVRRVPIGADGIAVVEPETSQSQALRGGSVTFAASARSSGRARVVGPVPVVGPLTWEELLVL